jgi:hypothetical protein
MHEFLNNMASFPKFAFSRLFYSGSPVLMNKKIFSNFYFLIYLKKFIQDMNLNSKLFFQLVNLSKREELNFLLGFLKKKKFPEEQYYVFLKVLLLKTIFLNNNKSLNLVFLVNAFLLILLKIFYFYPVYKSISDFVNLVCFTCFRVNNVAVSIFFSYNEGLTAKYLARFIGKKLKQGISLKVIMKPVVKDMLFVKKDGHYLASNILKRSNSNIKNIYKDLIFVSLKLNKKFFYKFFLRNFS